MRRPISTSAIFLILILSIFTSLKAQVAVSGFVHDEDDSPLPGATIKVFNSDSALAAAAITEIDGSYTVSLPANSKFTLLVTYISYPGEGKRQNFETTNEPLVLKKVRLKEIAKNLAEVEVKTTQTRGEQKGDTTQFNAAAFKTNPDASAEDLVKKMPGVTSDNNGLKVNGETVQKVLVDGKPFFGDDPNAALKNLPADMIDKVEVFDKMSDQSAFTGFTDGDQQKTINLVTKKSKNIGQFGRIYAGAGADESLEPRYNAGAALNTFNNKRRVTLLLLSNNVNQQNFSTADLSGAMGGSSQNRGGGGGRQGGNSALLASPQTGITTTQSAGLNYSDEWGKKITVSGSYFFNSSENLQSGNLERKYFTENDLIYRQSNSDRIFNINHRLNLRLEFNIDSANKIVYVPSVNIQDNTSRSLLNGENSFSDNVRLSNTSTSSKIFNLASDFSNYFLYQHKFSKQGRTISLSVNTANNNRDNNGSYFAFNNYSDTNSVTLDQQFSTNSFTKKYSGNLSFTEKLGKAGQLQLSYNPSITDAASDKKTMDYNPITNDFNTFNTLLSNKYSNLYETQRAGASYRYNNKAKLNFSFGADVQEARLRGKQTFPTSFELNQNFQNVLPNAMLNYKFNKTKNLRVFYRSNTNIPSITQLQNVIDISNPLQIKSGNAGLKQTFENNLNIRFGGFDPVTSKNKMLFINANYTDNYISNATYILKNDSLIQNYKVQAGSQLTKPVNLNGFYSARGFLVYGFPVSKLKSNMNFNGGLVYNHTPSLINDLLNYSNSYAANAGFLLGSNISEKLDFSIGYNSNYTIVKNTEQSRSDNTFYSQSTTFKINWIFLKGAVINTDVSHTLYTGLGNGFNQQYLLWNAYLGYKFLKDKSLEAKISVFDILNQNRSISRTVTGAYTEDNFTSVLRRYAMFSLTYTLKNFKSGTPPKTEDTTGQFNGSGAGGRRE